MDAKISAKSFCSFGLLMKCFCIVGTQRYYTTSVTSIASLLYLGYILKQLNTDGKKRSIYLKSAGS